MAPARGRSGAQTAAVRSNAREKTPAHDETREVASRSSPDGASESCPELQKGPSKMGQKLKATILGKHTLDLLDVMEDDSTSCLRRYALKLLMNPLFDYVMGVIILFNMVIMVVDMDRSAAGEEAETTGSWTPFCGWAILAIFCLELALRLVAFHCFFWKDPWNIFDFIIVVVDAAFSLVGLVVGEAFPLSILRIFRLAKLARISKVLRVFPELRVLLESLVGSTRAIFWGMVLLFFILLVWSMVGVLFIHPLISKMDFHDCDRCQEAYSSVMRSMLTLWQQLVANDEWGSVTMDVILQHPISIIFFMPMFMSVSMAIMNLILGVVVNVALSSKDHIDEEDASEKKLLRMERHTHILNVCDDMDVDRRGELSREAIFAKYEEPGEFRDSIRDLDVTEEEMEIIWTIVDHDKRGYAPYKDFVNRLYSIRSSDTEFMLAYIKYYITLIRHDLLTALTTLEENVEGDIEKIETMEEELIEVERQLVGVEKEVVPQTQLDGGHWEVLEDDKQELCKAPGSPRLTSPISQQSPKSPRSPRSPQNSKTKSKKCLHGKGSLYGQAEDRVYDERAWDKQLRRDMEVLQVSLKDILAETSRKFESQVAHVFLMNQKYDDKAEAVIDPQNVIQIGQRLFL